MRYIVFGPSDRITYPVALLTRYLKPEELKSYLGDQAVDTIAYTIDTEPKAKNPAIKEYLDRLLPVLANLQVDYIIATDASYFTFMTKHTQAAPRAVGYILPCKLPGYEHMWVTYMPSSTQMIYDPTLQSKVTQGLTALRTHRAGTYQPPGIGIIHFAEYPTELAAIQAWLDKIIDWDLSIDIETFDLKHYNAGIGSIAFAWNQHEGISFAVDHNNSPEKAKAIRKMLLTWFRKRTARGIYHSGSFDMTVLIYQLFMKELLDTAGKLDGLEVMLRNWDDTLLITYLATNSCAGNKLSLKDQAQEFAGDYMIDIKDISQVETPKLLEYNLIDALSTWYVYNKRYPQMIQDQQGPIYFELFKPLMTDIIDMQLTGMPIDKEAVAKGKLEMEAARDAALVKIAASPRGQDLENLLNYRWAIAKNEKLKVKRVTAADGNEKFNPNSGPQIALLLHDIMGLPILARTDTGLPATGKDNIEDLKIHCANNAADLELLQGLIEFKEVEKILTSFIPAFEKAPLASDGHYYLFGSFNLGGTLSGRLSSSGPNMQNIPSTGTKYAKIIKKMFKAPKGWLFVGVDYASLEDRISALTTKDPNKLKVYTDGYDGHSLRAFFYFREQMPDIVETLASINSIQVKYKQLRQDSKAPTFALTYQGTWRTLVVNCKFTPDFAKMVEGRYHEMYSVSDQWVSDKLNQAAKDGYVTVAFGLRLRTPMMQQSVMGTRKTPYEAVAEGRTAGNALGQSYGLLNSRSANAFLVKARASEWARDIKPCAQIHDAQYYLVRDNAETLEWVNTHLIEEVKWQNLPEIEHPDVKLGGELSVFYPNWATELIIPNGATADQIFNLAKEHLNGQ